MPFQHKKIFVVGATSGIGFPLFEYNVLISSQGLEKRWRTRFVSEGSNIIAVGRRKGNLDALVSRHDQKVEAVQFDITKLDEIPSFADTITKDHPDVNCIVFNSGIQRKSDFSDPSSIDLDTIHLEFVTNYLSYLALTKAFLPFLKSKRTETALIYISSGLALVPLPRVSNYCATKAALHQWILSLREHLKPF